MKFGFTMQHRPSPREKDKRMRSDEDKPNDEWIIETKPNKISIAGLKK